MHRTLQKTCKTYETKADCKDFSTNEHNPSLSPEMHRSIEACLNMWAQFSYKGI